MIKTGEQVGMRELIGVEVIERSSKRRGIIAEITDNKMRVWYEEGTALYPFPACLEDTIILKEKELQEQYKRESSNASFDTFKNVYRHALNEEISYLREMGGKHYRIIDGERLQTEPNTYIYSFETDSELHFPDGTGIKLWFADKIVLARVVACEEFTIIIQVNEFIGQKVESVEFTAEPWQLMVALEERISELKAESSLIAYEVACKGKTKIDSKRFISYGQDLALSKSKTQPVTFIWGPPGTGKTTTLAKIALEHMQNHERVLMLSYSNVSVDGALLKVADISNMESGEVIRYGYPRMEKLLESKTLTSYSYVLHTNPYLEERDRLLKKEKDRLSKKDPKRLEIQKQLEQIRTKLSEQEKLIVQKAKFVATTVAKAIVDKTIYMQKFDVVIFDEASMAYVPQIIFAASLAKRYFCCMGDFRQLPAIVQNPKDTILETDIFEYTDVKAAAEDGYYHEWLVMLNCQYRMHPKIADFVSKNMYGGYLQSANGLYENRQMIANIAPIEKATMGLIDLSGTYSVCIKTMDGSKINLMSAMMCIKLAEMIHAEYGVGIITPYTAQARLILAMLRDLRERDARFSSVRCATVHQFQGSEEPVVIYDAVDCFRMRFPGTLLTSKKNDTANRLFNVAMTRAQGKFILVANKEYMFKKNISKDLIFTKGLRYMSDSGMYIKGEVLFEKLGTLEDEIPEMFLGDRDEVDSWERYLKDIENSQEKIFMDVPGPIDDDEEALKDLAASLNTAEQKNVKIYIRAAETVSLPLNMRKYCLEYPYVTTPVTVIDKCIVWFGEPLSSANFVSEGLMIKTKYFPCFRFAGKHTARMIKAILEMPT